MGLIDGTFFCVDTHTSNRYDESGKLKSFAVRERPWYTGAIEAGGLYFTGIEKDAFVSGAEQFDDLTMLCIEYHGV